MAAVIQTTDSSNGTIDPFQRVPRLRLVSPAASGDRRDVAPVTYGNDQASLAITPSTHPTPAAVYVRRRLVAVAGLIVFIVSIAGGAALLTARLTAPGGAPLSAPGSTQGSPGSYDTGSPTESPLSVSAHETHVVQPGDTLWSIASDLVASSAQDRDHGAVVAELAELNGGSSLVVGQQIDLPVRADLAFDRP